MGSCGVAPYSSNVFYLYDADSKTLTIKGNGAIRDYASAAEAPWSNCDVEKITIDGGITRIGEYAFANLLKIKQEDVTIAQGVEVADNAFAKQIRLAVCRFRSRKICIATHISAIPPLRRK